MELVRQIGGKYLAAPAAGANEAIDPRRVAERYRVLLDIGANIGVTPQLEIWGHSKSLGRLGQAMQAAIDADHPSACVLADVFHLYKGGSGWEGLKLVNRNALHVFHMNDYPADPPRAEITDAHRVFPGDGIGPLKEILRTLHGIGFEGFLSLELFNRDYWKQDAKQVVRTGLEKMRAVARAALA
jgi:sugar phosphate isomerase/epimerase